MFQVAATDVDEGINAKITYSITGGQNRSHFNIDGDTGVIRTASVLDFEKINVYFLNVTGKIVDLILFCLFSLINIPSLGWGKNSKIDQKRN